MAKDDLPNTTPLMVMGILLITLGIIAIATPAVAGKAVVMVIGTMLLIAGVIQVVSGLRSEGWVRKLPPLISLVAVASTVKGLARLAEDAVAERDAADDETAEDVAAS